MAIITVSQVTGYLKHTAIDNDIEQLISVLIDRVQKSFEAYCNTAFESASYTEYYDGTGTSFLFLKNIPVVSISSIYDDANWLWETGSLLPSADYRITNDNSVYYKSYFTNDIQNIKITYVAGYASGSIPEDLQQAAIEEVGRKYKHSDDYDLTAKSLSDGSITYTEKGLLVDTKRILNQYRRLYVC